MFAMQPFALRGVREKKGEHMRKSTTRLAAALCVLGTGLVSAQDIRRPDGGHEDRHRFIDKRDGTIVDTLTGLMWEQKTGTVGGETQCITLTDCADPTNVNNRYTWSVSGTAPDGSIFTNFIEILNGRLCNVSTCQGLGSYTDWRVPTLAELQTVFDCSFDPCIDPIFGPTQPAHYWSLTTIADIPTVAWHINFNAVASGGAPKDTSDFVRAVRGTSRRSLGSPSWR
jgi:hypothetical protein